MFLFPVTECRELNLSCKYAYLSGILWLNIYFYRTQVNLGSDLWVRMSVRTRRCASYASEGDRFYTGRFELVEPTNAIGVIWWPNLEPMQVAPEQCVTVPEILNDTDTDTFFR